MLSTPQTAFQHILLLLLLLLHTQQMKLGLYGKYKCGHNIILAHAKTVQMYRQKYKPAQDGKLSIALDGKWGYAKDPKNPAGEIPHPHHQKPCLPQHLTYMPAAHCLLSLATCNAPTATLLTTHAQSGTMTCHASFINMCY
jgi:hypothetical protein